MSLYMPLYVVFSFCYYIQLLIVRKRRFHIHKPIIWFLVYRKLEVWSILNSIQVLMHAISGHDLYGFQKYSVMENVIYFCWHKTLKRKYQALHNQVQYFYHIRIIPLPRLVYYICISFALAYYAENARILSAMFGGGADIERRL